MTTSFRELEAAALDAMTADERQRFDAAAEEEEARLVLAELVYQLRTGAGITQTALAGRIGTKQSVISAIENGVQVPTFPMLTRIARAVGSGLYVSAAPINAPTSIELVHAS